MKLLLATNNAHKVAEIKCILGDKFDEILTLKDVGLNVEVEEDGETFFENAFKKASVICEMSGLPSLADDTGLEVDSLNGEPGVYSARYAGKTHDDAANNRKLLDKLKGKQDRSARFVTSIVLCVPEKAALTAEGQVRGWILDRPRGNGGFGYDPLFYCAEIGKTFGQASEEEKNAVSHRARALAGLLEKL